MRKLFRISTLTVLALSLLALTAQAQRAKQFGIVAGVDFSSLTGDHIDQSGTRTGFTGGLFLGIPIGDNWTFEPELLYAMKGGQDSYTDIFDVEEEDSYNLDYLQIPLLVRYNMNPDGGLYFFFGPSISIPVTCSVSVQYDGENVFDDTCENLGDWSDGIWDISAKTVISGTLGLGFSKGRFGIEGRYGFDWMDAIKDETTDEDLSIKNNVWAILVRVTK